jgi:hypothetical protein
MVIYCTGVVVVPRGYADDVLNTSNNVGYL